MKHRVYMRDWYFNAGIVGFLRVISNDAMPDDLKKIEGLEIGDNYIEFEDYLLEGFIDKFIRMAFSMLKDLSIYSRKLNIVQKDISGDKSGKLTVKKACGSFSSSYEKFNKVILKQNFEESSDLSELSNKLNHSLDQMTSLDVEIIYDELIRTDEGKEYIDWFINGWQLKGITSSANLEKYAEEVGQFDYSKELKNNDICLSCQKRKSEFEFNNSISNVIGFNKDNTNWIWGFKSSKTRLCGICSLIYTSAFLSMVKVHRYINENAVDCFYFINRNSDMEVLYKSSALFRTISKSSDRNKPFILIIKDTIFKVLEEQAKTVDENINFIEMAENPVLAGQSSKGYNIYNYSITPDLASFLKNQVNSIPQGFYKTREGSYSIDDELIQKSINYTLGYSDIDRYFSYYVRDGIISAYNIYQVNSFIFSYINQVIQSGGEMEDRKNVINKAFYNGKELADLLKLNKRENQIDGIVYGLLNDLKISDKEKFLDKYIRLMMSHKMELKFGSNNEMADTDSFLQFGYSFINGLLSNHGKKIEKENTNG